MTTEVRSQLNVRLSADANISVSVATFVADASEAREAGARNAEIVNEYLTGYNGENERRAAE